MGSVDKLVEVSTPAKLQMSDTRRNIELYRYLTPASLSSIPAAQQCENLVYDASNLTPSLIPHVQLVALRCDAAKAIINVIDKDTMYYLAQVSKRTGQGSSDIQMFGESEDSVITGCSSTPVSGRVCELTIRMQPDGKRQFPMFVVPDMSRDARFSQLDVVTGGPKYKFYAGTPITTRDGVNIGSLAVMDTEPRDGLTEDEERCMGETAAHVMSLLELNREAIEGRRARRMASALNSFMAGKSSMDDEQDRSPLRQNRSADVASSVPPQRKEGVFSSLS